ncbi:meiosis regulator and mRNA stability factor 1 isoform X2 [Anthonomus grandis grandis]|uniref:meiosis regulator and mRNA stability factor 1 isoform X2 n=1 Tax=Anthonomus grandis grandis TaxID=2921223 RepID=UPI002164FD96|nr:meiosis regulator and mRNA stability factor 1 isoform X2 [Anthonomus grandis grandis]
MTSGPKAFRGRGSTGLRGLRPVDIENISLSDAWGTRESRFKPFRLSTSLNNSDESSASVSDAVPGHRRPRRRWNNTKMLPPMGIFWDIENVSVPKNTSASSVVQRIREVFLEGYRESDFVVVCDVTKEPPQIIKELHEAQVNIIHVSATSKNAADDKLRQSIRRFAEVHPAPSAILLISGDINFASDLSDLRYRNKMRVFLLHTQKTSEALISCANEDMIFSNLIQGLPLRGQSTVSTPESKFFHYVSVRNLPKKFERGQIYKRLNTMVDNCGGKCVTYHSESGCASLRFRSNDEALRAQKRLQGENVFGQKIDVCLAPNTKAYTGQRMKNQEIINSLQQKVGGRQYGNNTSRNFESNVAGYQPATQWSGYGSMGPPPPPGFENRAAVNAYPYNPSSRKVQEGMGSLPSLRTPPINMDWTGPPNFRSTLKLPTESPMGSNCVSPMEMAYDQLMGSFNGRIAGTILPPAASALPPPFGRVHRVSGCSEFSSDGEAKGSQPVDLNITNLDPTIDVKELKKLLVNLIKEYAMIINLQINLQADGTPVANLRVNSQHEAQCVISQLHRQKIGKRRIMIGYDQDNTFPEPEHLKVMVVSLLQEVPDKKMPLFQFMELLESRYHCTVSVSRVSKLKDVVKINDERGSRIIYLTEEATRISPAQNLTETLLPYCVLHCPKGIQNIGWCESNTCIIPNVLIPLPTFKTKLLTLLNDHFGSLPLLSFQSCYEQEFQEPLPVSDSGVPLEHLITCVPNIEIKLLGLNKSIKVIQHNTKPIEETTDEKILKSVAPSLIPNINLLCREVVDLLKNMDKCQISLRKFIPAYHHHFGRQCRVADYGFTKLWDLLEAISHVVQIMSDSYGGDGRTITLTHSAQMRRFTSDLLRVLKLQPNKQIPIQEFSAAYERALNKPFNPVEYGLCTLDDLLCEISENTVVIMRTEEGVFISVPKREQTPEEASRTKQFAGEIKELPDGVRTVSLTSEQSLKVLSSQVLQVIRSVDSGTLKFEDLPQLYFREFGYSLNPQVYQCDSLEDLVDKLGDFIQVIHNSSGSLLKAVEIDASPNIVGVRCWALLLCPPHVKDLNSFRYEYRQCYNNTFCVESLRNISYVVSLSTMNNTEFISLTTLYILAAQLYYVICNNNGAVEFSKLEKTYEEYYCKPLQLSSYNINSVNEFYNKFNLIFYVRGSKKKSVVVLNRNLQEHIAFKYDNNNQESEGQSQWGENAVRKYSPPKPDTPPTPGTTVWWNTPSKLDQSSVNFSVNVPLTTNPSLLTHAENLVSPARFLTMDNPWRHVESTSEAPEPYELPLPDKLLSRGGISDDSGDSGVNILLENSDSELQQNMASKGAIKKKSLYGTFLNFK